MLLYLETRYIYLYLQPQLARVRSFWKDDYRAHRQFFISSLVYYPIWNSKKIPYYKICEVVLHFMIWPPCQRRRITFQIGFCCVAKRPKELVLHIKLFYIYCVSTVKFDLIPRIRSHNMWNLLDFCKLSIEAYYL